MIIILLIVAGLIALILLAASFKPAEFRIARHAVISAPPETVFAKVNSLREWQQWSPWEKLDPSLKRSYAGPAAGTGAIYAWDGNKHVGAGRMTVLESRPCELIRIKLEFFKPMANVCTAEFKFEQVNRQTAVEWSMFGRSNFVGKVMCLFMNMDKMCGAQFEKGLADLRKISEATQPAQV